MMIKYMSQILTITMLIINNTNTKDIVERMKEQFQEEDAIVSMATPDTMEETAIDALKMAIGM